MRSRFSATPLFVIISLAALLWGYSQSATAHGVRADEPEVRIDLGTGVSIALAGDWLCLGVATREAISATAYQRLSRAGLSSPAGSLSFAANLVSPEGGNLAMVNVRFYPEPTGEVWEIREQTDLKDLSDGDLRSLDKRLQEEVRASLDAIGAVGLRWHGVRRTKADGKWALLIEYTRAAMLNDGQYLVRVLRVPLGGRSLSVTASYRIGQESTLKPIVDRVLDSIAISSDEPGARAEDGPQPQPDRSGLQTNTRSGAESTREPPLIYLLGLSYLAALAGSSLGGSVGRLSRKAIEVSRQRRLFRFVVRALLVLVCVFGPLVLVAEVESEWDSPKWSGTFVEVVDLSTGRLIEDESPPLTEGEFRDARRVTRDDLQREIRNATRRLLGQPPEPAPQQRPSKALVRSDLFQDIRDPILDGYLADRARWTERVRASRIDELLGPIVLRDMTQSDLVARLVRSTGLNESVVASDVEGAVRLAKLQAVADTFTGPIEDDYILGRYFYHSWSDWFDRDPVLLWWPVVLFISGLAIVASTLAFFGFR
jgi:hypothetical protein